MNKEILPQNTHKKFGTIKNYCTIVGMQVMLTILGGCESSVTTKQETIHNNTKIEINDSANIKKLAKQYETIGIESGEKQNQTIAIPNFIKALQYYQKLGNKKKEQIITKNIAIGYYQQGNYPKYLEYIQKASALAKEMNYEYGIWFANSSLGGYHYEIKNQPEIALQKFYLPGRENIQNLDNEEDKKELQGIYATEIANCYMTLKEYKQAQKYREIAIKINNEMKNNIGNAIINYNMGASEQNQKHDTEAEKYYLKGLTLSKQEEEKNVIKKGCTYLANFYDMIGDHEKAYEYRTEEGRLAQEINNETSSKTQIELETSVKDKQLTEKNAQIIQQQEKAKTLEAQKQKGIWITIAAIVLALGTTVGSRIRYKKNKMEKEKNKALAEKKAEVEAVNDKLEESNNLLEETNTQLEDKNIEVEQKNKELERKNKSITDSIHYAKRIQESFIQHPEKLKELFPESFMFFQPKDIVSGDFYRFKETASGKKIIAAVDCTGHGVPGAFLTLIGNNILNDSIEAGKENPGEILDYLSGGIQEQLRANKQFQGDAIKDAMDIAIFSYDPKTEMFESAGAYNTIYIFKKGQMQKISGDKRPIGHDDKKYTNKQLTIEKGSTVYLGTDGYADQFGGPKMKKMMKKKLTRLLEDLQKQQLVEGETERRFLTIQEQGEIVKKEFNDRKGDNEQTDDVLLIGIKV